MVLRSNGSRLRQLIMAYGVVKFANGGEVKLLANAATKYRFRQIFGLDLMNELAEMDEKRAPGHVCEIIEMLAYTMAMQAKGEADKGSIDDFFIWLEDKDANDITESIEDVLKIYQGNQKSLSEIKNPEGPQSVE